MLLLEEEDRARAGIKKALSQIDPNIVVRSFISLEELSFWFEKTFINFDDDNNLPSFPNAENLKKLASDDRGNIDEVLLLIFNHTAVGPEHERLIRKISQFFVVKKLAAEKHRLGVVFLAHETDDLDISSYTKEYFDNIIFKPFDDEVVVEKLRWALDPQTASQGEGLHRQKPHEKIEMLKEIEVKNLSTIGFTTVTDNPIEIGKMGRYHAEAFGTQLKTGCYAQCIACRPVDKNNSRYEADFVFFGIPPKAISEIRSSVEKNENHQTHSFPLASPDEFVSVIILEEDTGIREYLESELLNNFFNMSICSHSNLLDFLMDLDPDSAASEIYSEVEDDASHFAPIKIVTDITGNKTLRIDFAEHDRPLGFSQSEFKSIKSILANQLDSDLKKEVQAFWRQDVTDPLTICFENDKEKRFITIEGSQTVNPEERVITIRYSRPQEITAAMKSQSSIQPHTALILVSQKLIGDRDPQYWDNIIEKLRKSEFLYAGIKRPRLIAVTKELSDPQTLAQKFQGYDDVIQAPMDSSYLIAKLNALMPFLRVIDKPTTIPYVQGSFKAFSSINPVVKHVSEVELAIFYPRPLEIDNFRYFVFPFPELKDDSPKLLAKCILHEKDQDENLGVLNHFVFFGLGEHYNFLLRNWLMEQYALNKQEEEKKQGEQS